MAKHSKYEPEERKMIQEHLHKVMDALNDEPKWPKGIPYSDVGEKWSGMVSSMIFDIGDFDDEWHITPFEDEDD